MSRNKNQNDIEFLVKFSYLGGVLETRTLMSNANALYQRLLLNQLVNLHRRRKNEIKSDYK